jgi:hypothetical protein
MLRNTPKMLHDKAFRFPELVVPDLFLAQAKIGYNWRKRLAQSKYV